MIQYISNLYNTDEDSIYNLIAKYLIYYFKDILDKFKINLDPNDKNYYYAIEMCQEQLLYGIYGWYEPVGGLGDFCRSNNRKSTRLSWNVWNLICKPTPTDVSRKYKKYKNLFDYLRYIAFSNLSFKDKINIFNRNINHINWSKKTFDEKCNKLLIEFNDVFVVYVPDPTKELKYGKDLLIEDNIENILN